MRQRQRNRLTNAGVKAAEPGKHCDGEGLWLYKGNATVGRWVLRYHADGTRREMGLGGWPGVGLADARSEAERWRTKLGEGQDPILARQAEQQPTQKDDTSLATIAEKAFEARKAELKGDGLAGRWMSPLQNHVLPTLGKLSVTELHQRHIEAVLAPIWHSKADVARKALNRLSIVLRHAAAMGFNVDLQVTDKARALLGKSRHQPKNIPAMPWAEVPAFYASISNDAALSHLALRLLILTGVRSKPLRAIRTEQIDGDVWTIPGEDMKGRRGRTPEFRVPLSREALRVIELTKAHERGGWLFPNQRGRGCITDVAIQKLLDRRGVEARPHGFRTSLRVWLAEATDAPHEVAEACLAHVADSGVVRAYRRTDYLEQRRVLLERWADHVTGGTGAVIKMAAGQ